MDKKHWSRKLDEIYYDIIHFGNKKGLIVVRDKEDKEVPSFEETLDFVKKGLNYDLLLKEGMNNEITIDASWPLNDLNKCWERLKEKANKVPDGLLSINVEDIRAFGDNCCWCLKQLAKQESPELGFYGYVLLIIKDHEWKDVVEYAYNHSKGDFDAMMSDFYYRIR